MICSIDDWRGLRCGAIAVIERLAASLVTAVRGSTGGWVRLHASMTTCVQLCHKALHDGGVFLSVPHSCRERRTPRGGLALEGRVSLFRQW